MADMARERGDGEAFLAALKAFQQLFERHQKEGLVMAYTMEDFKRDFIKKHFPQLTPQEQREALERLPPDDRRKVLQSLEERIRPCNVTIFD